MSADVTRGVVGCVVDLVGIGVGVVGYCGVQALVGGEGFG